MTNRSKRRQFLKLAGSGAVATTLAGCNFGDVTDQTFEATPYAYGPEGRGQFGFEGVQTDTVEEQRSGEAFGVEGSVTVVSHVFSYGQEATVPDSSAWRVPTSDSWSGGVISTPALSAGGESQNPLATESLSELMTGETGGQFRQAMGLEGNQSWACGPERIDRRGGTMLGKETQFGVFAGVVQQGENSKVGVAVYAGRVQTGGDAVLAGVVDRRPVGGAGDPGPNCVTPSPDPDGDVPEEVAIDVAQAAMAERIERMIKLAETLEEADDEDANGSSITLPPSADLSVSNVRLVQEVEDSGLTGSNQTVSDPPIVADQPTAVLFDLDGSDLDELKSEGVKVWIEVGRANSPYTRRMHFWMRPADVKAIVNGDSPAARFHEMARDGDSETDPPIFSVDPTSVTVRITEAGAFGGHHEKTSTSTSVSNTTTLNRTLKVGFIEVTDPKQTTGKTWQGITFSYGDANGRAANFVRSVNSSYEFLRRVYPGEVVAYRHDTAITGKEMTHEMKDDGPDPDTGTGPDDTQAWGSDHKEGRETLNTVVQRSNFPNGGELYHSTVSESKAESMIRTSGLDVAVVILPRATASGNANYYNAHGVSASGKFIGRKKAVGALEALADPAHTNDLGHASITAQEIGHYFTGNPYRDTPNDPFSRTYTDNNGNRRDDIVHASSNLESVGYTLVDDTFTLVNDPEVVDGSFDPGGTETDASGDAIRPTHTSYMSYTGGTRWADSRVTTHLIRSEFDNYYRNPNPGVAHAAGASVGDVPASETSREDRAVEPVLEVYGPVWDGQVSLSRAWTYDGVPEDVEGVDFEKHLADNEAKPVEVTLLGPDKATPVHQTVVPDRTVGTHGHEVLHSVAISIPFDRRGVWLDAVAEGGSTRMNAIVAPIRDAVLRVPLDALAEGEESRERLMRPLVDADVVMQDQGFGSAADLVGVEFVDVVESEVEPYEGWANQPTGNQLQELAERQATRLSDL